MALLISDRVGREARHVGWVRPSDNLQGKKIFEFPDNSMAPTFPKGTRVALSAVNCPCRLTVGAVYVRLYETNTESRWVGAGRLEDITTPTFGAYPTLDFSRDVDKEEHWQGVPFSKPNFYWHKVEAYISLAI